MAIKSDYHYSTDIFQEKKFLVIVDEDRGGRSVTNNIEIVVREICRKENIDPKDHLIIYQDSDGTWDGWDYLTEAFVPLQAKSKIEAVNKFLSRTK